MARYWDADAPAIASGRAVPEIKPGEREAGKRRGQSLVELAVAFPLLMLILLGTIDVARVFFDYIQMRNAVVEGATYGSRHPFDTGGIADAVTAHGVPDDASIWSTTSGDCGTPRGDGTVIVTAQKTYTPIYVGVLEAVANTGTWSFSVRADSSMRCMTGSRDRHARSGLRRVPGGR